MRLIFRSVGPAARKSPTAAAITSTSHPANASRQAASISAAVRTRTREALSGASTSMGPATSVTAAPRASASRATATPMRPLDRLVSTRTGSRSSSVRPAVTSTDTPARSCSRPIRSTTRCTISSGSAMRPRPYSRHAIHPSSGPTVPCPRARRVSRFSRLAGLCHIRWFMAGAHSTLEPAAASTVVSASSAMPWAALARVLAVAGAITRRSASFTSSMCSTPLSSEWPSSTVSPS